MPSSADIRAGAAYVELSVNNSALVRGLKAAQKRLKGFASSVTAVGKRMVLLNGMMAMPFVGGGEGLCRLRAADGECLDHARRARDEVLFARQP